MLFTSVSVNVLLAALLASAPLVAAHGKVAVVTGDQGGNGTALGIKGAVVPGAGANAKTEVDTTVFAGKAADSCGKTEAGGTNDVESGTVKSMALSGSTLPQISSGGSISGTMHIVTSDGAGPYSAMIDTTGTGDFTKAVKMDVTTQVPGKNGNISKSKRWVDILARAGIMKRATNINEDYPFKVAIPAGTTCTGTVAGQSGKSLRFL